MNLKEKVQNKEKLIETIGTMLSETYETLQSTDEEGNDLGNIDWETV